jgi:hypothetical protein
MIRRWTILVSCKTVPRCEEKTKKLGADAFCTHGLDSAKSTSSVRDDGDDDNHNASSLYWLNCAWSQRVVPEIHDTNPFKTAYLL